MKNQRELSYAEIYSLPAEGFSSSLINALPISFRAISKLLAQGIKTLEELLNSSPQQIRKAIDDEQVYNEISNFIDELVFNDFSVTGMTGNNTSNEEIIYTLKKEEYSKTESASEEKSDIIAENSGVIEEASIVESKKPASDIWETSTIMPRCSISSTNWIPFSVSPSTVSSAPLDGK